MNDVYDGRVRERGVLGEALGIHMRAASAVDLDAIVAFEIDIARISFPDRSVEDPLVHARRVEKGIADAREGTFVACTNASGEVVGWTWISLRTNFLTGTEYGFLRSVAVDLGWRGTELPQVLIDYSIDFAAERGAQELVGKVHVANTAMRVAYCEAGFQPEHLTMRRRLPSDPRS